MAEGETRAWPRVRFLRRVEIHVGTRGVLDESAVRRAVGGVRPGDDVIVVVRGRLSFEPGMASWLGRDLATCRTITVEADGPGARAFAEDIAAAAAEAEVSLR